MRSLAEPVEQDGPWRRALQQHLVAQPAVYPLIKFPHLVIRGEEHKSPALRRLENTYYFFSRLLDEPRIARIGKVHGSVEQCLFLVVKMWREDLLAAVLDSQAPLQKIEVVAHRQRRRSQDNRFHLL